MEQGSLSLNGGQLSYRHAGQGVDVVLLHGISSRAASWHKQLTDPALCARCRLWAWDAPGYGDSTPLAVSRPRAADYARTLAHWLDALGLERATIVGHSLGAMMAAAFAAAYPQRVAGLAFADPAQGYGGADSARREQVFSIRRRQAEDVADYAQRRGPLLLRPGADAVDIATVRDGMLALRRDGFLAAARMLADDALEPYLRDYRGTLAVWCGAEDGITPAPDAAALAQRCGAPFRLIAAAGHASYLDAPEQFNRLLCDIARQSSGDGL
ncbi:alpha/beta fold hydrolase [Entomohabitans teleogrylli]|uniref:alpha/beta fold hydrolase n=1 Tax=Entomohabitans teleogrylli TaxID=1384589 RepID=UPI00073D6E27|nr:alpha/beta hydrolase [Entomohabitans teleogrylli]